MDSVPHIVELENERSNRRGRKGESEFVAAMAIGMSVTASAKAAGIARSTAYERLKEPEVVAMIEEARESVVGQSVGKLANAMGMAVDVLEDLLGNESARIRLDAAKTLMQAGARLQKSPRAAARKLAHDEKIEGASHIKLHFTD